MADTLQTMAGVTRPPTSIQTATIPGAGMSQVPQTNQQRMRSDWESFWNNTQAGQSVKSPGGTTTRNADGTATYVGSDGKSYNFNANQSFEDIARNSPGQAAEWANGYGFKPQTTLQDVASQTPQVDTSALMGLGNKASGAYDFYNNTLQGYYKDPSSFKLNPAYQSMYDMGLDAVNRTAAAKGMLGSGNRLYELQKFGSGLANQAWNSEVQNLGNLSNQNGQLANSSFTNAGQLQIGQQNANTNSLSAINQGNLGQQQQDLNNQNAMWNNYNNYTNSQANLYNTMGQLGNANYGNDFSWLGSLAGIGKGNGGSVAGNASNGAIGNNSSNNYWGQILSNLFGS